LYALGKMLLKLVQFVCRIFTINQQMEKKTVCNNKYENHLGANDN